MTLMQENDKMINDDQLVVWVKLLPILEKLDLVSKYLFKRNFVIIQNMFILNILLYISLGFSRVLNLLFDPILDL